MNNDTTTATAAAATASATTTPRDVRLLRLLLASHGVAAYDDHVPLQLMDFAHRYTAQVLQDALVYNDYGHPLQSNAGNIGNSNAAPNTASAANTDSHSSNTNTNTNTNGTGTGTGNNAGNNDDNDANTQFITNEDVRLAVAAITSYQFKPVPPKKMLMELANERNSKPLPAVMPMWGVRLPPEKYCLTAIDTAEQQHDLTDDQRHDHRHNHVSKRHKQA